MIGHRRFAASSALAVAAIVLAVPTAHAQGWRSVDGSFNNPLHGEWGAAQVALRRMAPCAYGDGIATPSGATRPNAREISNAVCFQNAPRPVAMRVTSWVWQWGQFVDHDLSLSDTQTPNEPFHVQVPQGDPSFDPNSTGAILIPLLRSKHDGGATLVDPRDQMNDITAWLDGSNVYGSDALRAAALRANDGSGLLLEGPGRMMPWNLLGLPNAMSTSPSFFLGGDVRANEQTGLAATHTLFVREHNELCRMLRRLFPNLAGERLYQSARLLLGAELQHITYDEWLPILVGEGAIPPYAGWRTDVDPTIANEFSTAAYRFGHTMLPPELLRLGSDNQPIAAGPLALRDAFFNPQALVQTGIEPVLRGLSRQRPQAYDPLLVDDVRNFLFGPPGAGGLDLASLNIQRGRDHGLPDYNTLREQVGLPKKASFAEVSSHVELQQRLASVYASPDEMDPWVGCLSEDPLPGALLGELAQTIVLDQFLRLRDADRFWYQRALPPVLVAWVEQQTLAKVIRRNTTIGNELQREVFRLP